MTDTIRAAAIEAACHAFTADDMPSFSRWSPEEQAAMRANMARAIEAYEAAMWRPIEECPPHKFKSYLVTRDGHEPIRVDRFGYNGPFRVHGTRNGLLTDINEPTHFRPLPDPPKEPAP